MAHDVFISYSSKDKNVADAVCAKLESHKVRCWIAPRDVPPGKSWAAAIVGAINESAVFVLVFSDGSNKSKQVVREVGEAVECGIPIVPLRIEDVEPSPEMRYYIKSIHWLDALTPTVAQYLNKLTNSVRALLSVEIDEKLTPETVSVVQPPAQKRWPLPRWASALLSLAFVGIVAGGAWFIATRLGSTTVDEEATSTTVDASASLGWSEWRTLTFLTPNPQIWEKGDNQYTAIKQHDTDAFAWSTETFEGDLMIRLDLHSAEKALDLGWNEMETQFPYQDSGCVIIYGEGDEFSSGCLIFCVNWDGFYLEKHTHYFEDYPLAFVPSSPFNKTERVYSVTIEISEDLSIMYVNGEEVLSSFFDLEEIDRSGRIGLFRNWGEGEITFSNIQVKMPAGSTD